MIPEGAPDPELNFAKNKYKSTIPEGAPDPELKFAI